MLVDGESGLSFGRMLVAIAEGDGTLEGDNAGIRLLLLLLFEEGERTRVLLLLLFEEDERTRAWVLDMVWVRLIRLMSRVLVVMLSCCAVEVSMLVAGVRAVFVRFKACCWSLQL